MFMLYRHTQFNWLDPPSLIKYDSETDSRRQVLYGLLDMCVQPYAELRQQGFNSLHNIN